MIAYDAHNMVPDQTVPLLCPCVVIQQQQNLVQGLVPFAQM